MAVRIAGVVIPNEKRIAIALTYIFGIGRSKANEILASLKISPERRTSELLEDEVNRLRETIEKKNRVEGELRRDIFSNIKRLKDIKCYRGSRHAKGLPVRGQNTKTNSRTVRGNKRVTMGSGKKPAAQKT